MISGAKPLGLLAIASLLRLQGLSVSYIDCQDRFHPKTGKNQSVKARNGRGPYGKTPLPPPKGLESIERNYSRYGILPEWFAQDLKEVPRPDMVLVTCLMTYWYPGLIETIRAVRATYPDVPVVLGWGFMRLSVMIMRFYIPVRIMW